MNVKGLIKRLEQFNPNANVVFWEWVESPTGAYSLYSPLEFGATQNNKDYVIMLSGKKFYAKRNLEDYKGD